ncbi:hypothetical protein KUL42_30020 [Alteromonas sp. KUL42]|nr:hypothetical protein KUL42_30020 [Alteromonas sp. KUL42]
MAIFEIRFIVFTYIINTVKNDYFSCHSLCTFICAVIKIADFLYKKNADVVLHFDGAQKSFCDRPQLENFVE